MPADPLPCDREEAEELAELRVMVSEYDSLIERCVHRRLDPEEISLLDSAYACLLSEEHSRWSAGAPVDPIIIESVLDQFDGSNIDFPLIRFALGILPGQNNTRSYA